MTPTQEQKRRRARLVARLAELEAGKMMTSNELRGPDTTALEIERVKERIAKLDISIAIRAA